MVGRTRGRGGALAVVLALVGVIGLVGPPAGAQATPSVTVTPSTGLLDGHPVQASGAGLEPGQRYVLLDCAAAGCVDSRAYYMTVSTLATPLSKHYDPQRRFVAAGPDGGFATSLRMWRTIEVGPWNWEGDPDAPDPTVVDCSTEPCWVAVAPYDEAVAGEAVAQTPVAFAATGTYEWEPGTISVEAPPRLPHRGTIHVAGTGYDPGWRERPPGIPYPPDIRGADLQVCASGPAAPTDRCRSQASPRPAVADDGSVDADVRVGRFLDLSGGVWDCAASPCTARLVQRANVPSPEVPLSFGPEWSPFASAAQMVDRLSEAVAGRPVSRLERIELISGLAGEGLSGADVLRTLVEEWAWAPVDVTVLYASMLGRRPDVGGLAFWSARIRGGRPSARIGEQLASTPEVRAWYGQLSDQGVVDQTYLRVLGRPAGPAGRAYWVGRLQAGLSRAQMITAFALSPESRTRFRDEGLTTALFFGIYERVPDAQEWANASWDPEHSELALWDAIGSAQTRALAA